MIMETEKVENRESFTRTFRQVIKDHPIRIPKIQRDYAQGRNNDTVKDIRDRFVSTLVDHVLSGKALELDFIYGNTCKDAFEPLDGQQRLTTLFLLHWVLGVTLFDEQADSSKLTYETRNTSSAFRYELVQPQHKAQDFRKEAKTKNRIRKEEIEARKEALKKLESECANYPADEYDKKRDELKKNLRDAENVPEYTIGSLIKGREWFDYQWQFDPTIQSMLVMIDALESAHEWKDEELAKWQKNLDCITFSFRDLDDLGLTNDLFVKMNSRGKPLSSFDIVKSTLEEEIQTQEEEGHSTSAIEDSWRSRVDGPWINWFWHMFASGKIGEITDDEKEYKARLGLAKEAENNLRCLILRVIALFFVRKSGLRDELFNVVYNDHLDEIDRVLPVYLSCLKTERTKLGKAMKDHVIDFEWVMGVINRLYYCEDDRTYRCVFGLIPEEYRLTKENGIASLEFIFDRVFTNDAKLIFYAAVRYLAIRPIELVDGEGNMAEKGKPKQEWTKDFVDWFHFCRNIIISENNNSRNDSPVRFSRAIIGIDSLSDELARYVKTEQLFSVPRFVASLPDIVGLDNNSLAEERNKASYSAEWRSLFCDAEKNGYLWGQIRCLVDWAEKDQDKFKNYSSKLQSFLTLPDNEWDWLRAGLLAVDRNFGFRTGVFCQSNRNRDLSMKRYLRDKDKTSNRYAPAMKKLIDDWTSDYPGLTAKEMLVERVGKELTSPKDYAWCILSMPSILSWAGYQRVFSINGHYVLASKKTEYSRCYDIALLYLYLSVKDKKGEFEEVCHYDSADVLHKYALSFKYGGDSVLITQEMEGKYSILTKRVSTEYDDERKLLEHVFATYCI